MKVIGQSLVKQVNAKKESLVNIITSYDSHHNDYSFVNSPPKVVENLGEAAIIPMAAD